MADPPRLVFTICGAAETLCNNSSSINAIVVVTEMQNDVGMTSKVVSFRFISLFGNNFTKTRYKFDENTSF